MTVFGYAAPASDAGAVTLLRDAWFARSDRQFEHVEVIDILAASALHERWTHFLPTGHLHTRTDIETSWLNLWPRRTSQALLHSMSTGMACETFAPPQTHDLKQLQQFASDIASHEKQTPR